MGVAGLNILVVNTGSSSCKLAVVDPAGNAVTTSMLDPWDGTPGPMDEALHDLVGSHDVAAIGHRVVHGGERFTRPVLLDDEVVGALEALTPLAPLHQPRALLGIAGAGEALPEMPAAACFDTSFHSTLPARAATYAIPQEWRTRHGLRRFGFHGLSHSGGARRAAELAGRPLEELRIVTAHLGGGASLCAVNGGVSVDTTMGFTPLEGLVMTTRSGSVDPGMLLWLQREAGLGIDALDDGLLHHSGLAGLSGDPSGDLRSIVPAAVGGDERALLALDVYIHRLRSHIAAMAASMEGLDVLAFTGGAGEHQPEIRRRAVSGLGFLGLELDEATNAEVGGDADVSAPGAVSRTVVVATREDAEIARQVRTLLAGAGSTWG
jgi:acetate kinase